MDARAANRYARALLAAAQQTNSVREAEEDLGAICRILDARPELRETLESPRVPRERKRELVDRLFADRARPITMRLLRLLIDKKRESEIKLIYRDYVRLRQDLEGILHVTLTSAVPLTQDEIARIVKRLETQTGKKIAYVVDVDSTLMGGVRIQYGDTQQDGTVAGALRRLREHLLIDVLKQA